MKFIVQHPEKTYNKKGVHFVWEPFSENSVEISFENTKYSKIVNNMYSVLLFSVRETTTIASITQNVFVPLMNCLVVFEKLKNLTNSPRYNSDSCDNLSGHQDDLYGEIKKLVKSIQTQYFISESKLLCTSLDIQKMTSLYEKCEKIYNDILKYSVDLSINNSEYKKSFLHPYIENFMDVMDFYQNVMKYRELSNVQNIASNQNNVSNASESQNDTKKKVYDEIPLKYPYSQSFPVENSQMLQLIRRPGWKHTLSNPNAKHPSSERDIIDPQKVSDLREESSEYDLARFLQEVRNQGYIVSNRVKLHSGIEEISGSIVFMDYLHGRPKKTTIAVSLTEYINFSRNEISTVIPTKELERWKLKSGIKQTSMINLDNNNEQSGYGKKQASRNPANKNWEDITSTWRHTSNVILESPFTQNYQKAQVSAGISSDDNENKLFRLTSVKRFE